MRVSPRLVPSAGPFLPGKMLSGLAVLGALLSAVTVVFAVGCSSAGEKVRATAPLIPSESELALLASDDLTPPRMLSRSGPLRLTNVVPCPMVLRSKVLVTEEGEPIGVKLDESHREHAQCENAVINYLLRARFEPARRNAIAVVGWLDVPISLYSEPKATASLQD